MTDGEPIGLLLALTFTTYSVSTNWTDRTETSSTWTDRTEPEASWVER